MPHPTEGAKKSTYVLGPGAEPLPTPVDAMMQRADAALPASYVPRTKHLLAGSRRARFANRLLAESSPYLRQHAHNPVDWHPWGDEAFAKARALGRPVLLSVGYSTCHWCHVMEEESFEDETIAAYMNAHYVCVKVDREERPDVDSVYMAAVQALAGQGGWPMTVWLTPDREPFYGGTYFPPYAGARGARLGFIDVLTELSRLWNEDRERASRAAADLVAHVRAQLSPSRAAEDGPGEGNAPELSTTALDAAYTYFSRAYDPQWGGLARAPKFPSNFPVRLMLRQWLRTGDEKPRRMAEHTLTAMAAGGIRDHVGGGFHRYAVDEEWLVPHFEKMLYDNAQLALAYVEGWQATGRDDFRAIATETLDYVLRELTAPDGAFWSATDADSPFHDGREDTRREEGLFHTWTPAEVEAVVGASRGKRFAAYYGITPEGNFEGRNVLHTPETLALVAAELGVPERQLEGDLAKTRAELYKARALRPPPLLDDKIIAGWNGLMIGALATAGFALTRQDYVDAAVRAADAVFAKLVIGGRLRRTIREQAATDAGTASPAACLEDYATLLGASLDLLTATGDPRWLATAETLATEAHALLWDGKQGGYYLAPAEIDPLFVREKPLMDLAIPSGNALMALHLQRLHAVTEEARYAERVEAIFHAFAPLVAKSPAAFSELLIALDRKLAPKMEIVAVGVEPTASPLLAPVRSAFLPHAVVLTTTTARGAAWEERSPLFRGRVRAPAPEAAAYICRNQSCGLPAEDAAAVSAQLKHS